jgi:hypothetical protein
MDIFFYAGYLQGYTVDKNMGELPKRTNEKNTTISL